MCPPLCVDTGAGAAAAAAGDSTSVSDSTSGRSRAAEAHGSPVPADTRCPSIGPDAARFQALLTARPCLRLQAEGW
jgi:hypothetical protein